MAHVRLSRPDSGLCFQIKFCKTVELSRLHSAADGQDMYVEFRLGVLVEGLGLWVRGYRGTSLIRNSTPP